LTGCRKGPVRAPLETGPLGTFALDPARAALAELVDRFGRDNVAVELTYARDPLADERYDALTRLAREANLPMVATTAAHYHAPPRRRLATVMAAVRARSCLDDMDGWLPAWAGAHLRSGEEMAARFARWPGVVETAGRLGAELAFGLELIAPALPPFPVPEGHGDEMAYLRELTYAGAAKRYGPRGTATDKAYAQLEHELGIIEQLGFPGYFLVVWELVEFCRREGILCQGRGSAANSAVCYALGVTAVDAIRYELLFERFLSPERDGPPDIDVDIESDRREEVIQHVYATHGREYAAQVANVVVTWNLSTRMIVPSSLNHGLERSLSGTVVLEKWPVLVRHEQAAAWLQLWIDLGRAPRTIDAYARGLAEYLIDPHRRQSRPRRLRRTTAGLGKRCLRRARTLPRSCRP